MKPYGNQVIAEFINCSRDILNNRDEIEGIIKTGIDRCDIGLIGIVSHQFNPVGITVIAIISESHIAVHTYPEARHVSIDIFTCSPESKKIARLINIFKDSFMPQTFRTIDILRGNPIEVSDQNCITAFSGYGFETRYHIKKPLFSKKLKYQRIDIIENENFGRMLFLDNDLQIAERDSELYHHSVISPIINEKGSALEKVAILGGGDGGVLNEILRHNPCNVALVEIEGEIIDISERYLGSICKDAFKQPNVNIVIDDANSFLRDNQDFDAIIYDLTMHPASLTSMERKFFLEEVFQGIKNSLNIGGIISLQCCPEYDEETFRLLKDILLKNFSGVIFKRVFIPPFCEKLIFASGKRE